MLIVVGVVRDTFFGLDAELKLHGYDETLIVRIDADLSAVLMGPPGAGKGTQAQVLREKSWIAADRLRAILFRDNLKRQTPLGQHGTPVIWIAANWCRTMSPSPWSASGCGSPTAQNGAMLDGFPRTLPQAEALRQPAGRVRRAGEPGAVYQGARDDVCWSGCRPLDLPRPGTATYHDAVQPTQGRPGCAMLTAPSFTSATTTSPNGPVTAHPRFFGSDGAVDRFYRARGVLREIDGQQPIDQVSAARRSGAGRAASVTRAEVPCPGTRPIAAGVAKSAQRDRSHAAGRPHQRPEHWRPCARPTGRA